MPDGIACVCFYDAERVLSTIAKFLVYLLGEGEGRGDMRDCRGRRREWGGVEIRTHENIAAKRNIYGIW